MEKIKYSEEMLAQIEQYASIYLKITDIAVLFDIPAEQLREDIADRSTEVSKHYHKGKAASKVKLLHQEMQLAYVGSPLALENAQKNLMDMEDDEWGCLNPDTFKIFEPSTPANMP